jgi:hypothetical protein
MELFFGNGLGNKMAVRKNRVGIVLKCKTFLPHRMDGVEPPKTRGKGIFQIKQRWRYTRSSGPESGRAP